MNQSQKHLRPRPIRDTILAALTGSRSAATTGRQLVGSRDARKVMVAGGVYTQRCSQIAPLPSAANGGGHGASDLATRSGSCDPVRCPTPHDEHRARMAQSCDTRGRRRWCRHGDVAAGVAFGSVSIVPRSAPAQTLACISRSQAMIGPAAFGLSGSACHGAARGLRDRSPCPDDGCNAGDAEPGRSAATEHAARQRRNGRAGPARAVCRPTRYAHHPRRSAADRLVPVVWAVG